MGGKEQRLVPSLRTRFATWKAPCRDCANDFQCASRPVANVRFTWELKLPPPKDNSDRSVAHLRRSGVLFFGSPALTRWANLWRTSGAQDFWFDVRPALACFVTSRIRPERPDLQLF